MYSQQLVIAAGWAKSCHVLGCTADSGMVSWHAEELLAEIAAAVGCPVAVSEVRSHIMRLAGVPESAFTLEQGDDRLRLMPRSQLTLKRLAELNRVTPTMAIVASGAPGLNICILATAYITTVSQWR